MTKLAAPQLDNVSAPINIIDHGAIDLDDTLAADGDYCGITARVTVDATATFAMALVLSSDGNYDASDADAEATMPCMALAIDTGAGTGKRVLLNGYIREDDWAWTPGGII